MHKGTSGRHGFTLIELSIVLVIIGLIVGGILVSRDLISAAQVRAQLTQIEKYNTAVNTFHTKYNAIPGDMNVNTATQFGFVAGNSCNGGQGGRDGNGLIDGYTSPYILNEFGRETGFFWVDISSSAMGQSLIDGTFPNSGGSVSLLYCPGAGVQPTLSTTPGSSFIGNYIPAAKIGNGNFVYVYETNNANWFGVSAVTSTNGGGNTFSNSNIIVLQAYNMDKNGPFTSGELSRILYSVVTPESETHPLQLNLQRFLCPCL